VSDVQNGIDDREVLNWFENTELAQAITTHAMASGILRMREKDSGKRKRRPRAKKDEKQESLGV
jgi:hypothetical protein